MSGRSGRSSASSCRHSIVARAWHGRFSTERSPMPGSAASPSWRPTRWTSPADRMTIPCGSAPNRCTTPPGSKRWPGENRLGRLSESAPPEAAGKFGLSSREFPGRHQRNTRMDKAPQVKLHSTAHYFLEGLNDIGVEYLFSNFGTDHAPLIEEMARWKKDGRRYPKVLNCPHENTAMHMAAGFAIATGRGQAVMGAVDAGTADSAMAMDKARRGRLPLVLMAGKAPYTVRGELPGSRDNYVHFIQEPFDQSGIVRPYAKWEWTLPSGVMTKETLRRAHTVAHSDPMGPVYLMLPRETLTQTWDEAAMRPFPGERYGAVSAGAADAAAVAQVADKLLSAKHPVMITSYAGRNLEAPALIDEIARLAGIRVFEAVALYLHMPPARA